MLKSLLATLIFLYAMPLQALSPALPDAQLMGEARMRVLLWDVYDAKLYTSAESFSFDQPFALELNYLMTLAGDEIAERSVEEMREQGYTDEVKLAAWYAQMRDIFPDVEDGSTLTGVYKPGAPTEFYQHATHIGTIRDPEFGRWFFGIWLSENTSAPDFRSKLLSL